MVAGETANCKDKSCGALVYVTDIPSKKSGYCWRCEVKRLGRAIKRTESLLSGVRIPDVSRAVKILRAAKRGE